MPDLLSFKQKTDLSNYTLIIPSVSVGNVPQLTIDLLITTLNFQNVATLWHPAIVSSVGGDPYEAKDSEICTACELYINEKLKLALLQIRSTINFKLATKFFADLKAVVLQQQIKNILVLASAFDYELHNVSGQKFFYITNENVQELMEDINVKAMEMDINGKFTVHGSGYAPKLFEIFSEANLKCTVLIKYVSEGDNRPDALMTLEVLRNFLQVIKKEGIETIKFPSSWSCVFGGPPPLGIY